MTDELTPPGRQELYASVQLRRRRRRRRWRIAIGILLAVIALLLLAGFIYGRHWQWKLNAKLAALRAQGKLLTFKQMVDRRKELPADKNSALIYLDAFKQYQKTPQGEAGGALYAQSPMGTRPSQATLDLLNADAAANAGALAAISRAAPLRDGAYPLGPAQSPYESLMDYLQSLRQCTHICQRIALMHAAENDSNQASADLLACLGLASSVGRNAEAMEGLVREAADLITIRGLESSLALCQFSPSDLRALQDRFQRECDELSRDEAMVFERSALQHGMENAVSNPRAQPLYGRMQFASGIYAWLYGCSRGWRKRDDLFFLSEFDQTDQLWVLPPRQGLIGLKALDAGFGSRRKQVFPPPVMSGVLVPLLSRALQEGIRRKMELSVAAAALAAERYRLKNGRWPAALDQLVPGFLDSVPDDYFGPGKIRYKLTDTGALLYSIGPDNADQGGLGQDEIPNQAVGQDAYDMPFRLLNRELRGAKTMTFREEVVGSGISLQQLRAAGLDEAALKRLGLTEEDVKKLP